MKVGVILPLFSGDARRVVEVAREAEALGFDGVFAFDHFFPPGRPPDRPSVEAFTTLAAAAASTERVAVGTLVTRVSLRPAGLLAKTASWLDAASGGRFVLGVGTGDRTDLPEHEAYGLPVPGRAERREHLEETVAALKTLFEGRRFEGGRHVPAVSGPLNPGPVRAGGPPIWVAGLAEQVIRIAGRTADGWNGWGLDVPAFERKTAVLAEEADRAGRAVEPTWAGIVLVGRDREETARLLERRRARGMNDEAWVGTAEELAGFLRGLAEAGATWAALVHAGPRDRRALVAEEVLPAL